MVRYILGRQERSLDLDINRLLESPSKIKEDFRHIWNTIVKNINVNIGTDTAFSELENLVIYEALDGSRSTCAFNKNINPQFEGPLYVIKFMHILKLLGAKTCCMMVHTSYNRDRGQTEFNNVICAIEEGAPLIKNYGIENNVFCSCMCINKNYELKTILNDITESTRNGEFCTHFLFDYNEEWAETDVGLEAIKNLPEIDVHIRHTKFQFSGGWIPGKMSKSVFLYSQNGSTYSNWDTNELITLISLSLLAKLFHKGEALGKIYKNDGEIIERYKTRELKLFNKIINLRDNPKKLFMIGSPVGVYQFYY